MATGGDERLNRAHVALQGLSVGDAYGNHHGNNPRKLTTETWEYSDDTLTALSIFAVLRRHGRIEQDELAQSFAERWDDRRGYGQGVTRLLKRIQMGGSWRELSTATFDGKGSFGNGAAMRVAPLGAYFADDMAQVVEQARLSSLVTHAHPEAIAGAIAVAVSAALDRQRFLFRILPFVPHSEVHRKIEMSLDLPLDTSTQQAANVLGHGRPAIAQMTVPFTLWASAVHLESYETAITSTAGVHGDVDTNCAIVGGIVVMYVGDEDIPEDWRRRREALPVWPFRD